MIKNRKK